MAYRVRLDEDGEVVEIAKDSPCLQGDGWQAWTFRDIPEGDKLVVKDGNIYGVHNSPD